MLEKFIYIFICIFICVYIHICIYIHIYYIVLSFHPSDPHAPAHGTRFPECVLSFDHLEHVLRNMLCVPNTHKEANRAVRVASWLRAGGRKKEYVPDVRNSEHVLGVFMIQFNIIIPMDSRKVHIYIYIYIYTYMYI